MSSESPSLNREAPPEGHRRQGGFRTAPETASDRGERDVAVAVRNAGKCYQIYGRPQDRLKQALWRGRRKYYRDFWALREVSFEVERGEAIGVIGRNGSGKSTLLQIIAGTLAPSEGEVEVNGRVAALLELGSGFNPDFTGRENVFMNGAILGLSQEEIERKYDDIVAFADIGDFVDQPVKTYSSGMVVRLAFAVSAHVEAQVLIVDEALAVGDEGFQRKCIGTLERHRAAGGTVLLVTHDTQTVVRLSERALLLEQGRAVAFGRSKAVVDIYHKMLYGTAAQRAAVQGALLRVEKPDDVEGVLRATGLDGHLTGPTRRNVRAYHDTDMIRTSETVYGTGDAEITDVETFDEQGERANVLVTGRPCQLCYQVRFLTDAEGVRFGMMIKTKEGVDVAGVSNAHLGAQIESIEAGQVVSVAFRLQLNVAPGTYFLNAGVGCLRNGQEVYLQRRVDVTAIRVIACDDRDLYGLAFLDPDCEVRLIEAGMAQDA